MEKAMAGLIRQAMFVSRRSLVTCSRDLATVEPMKQVEVDEKHVKDQLGQRTLAFVKKAERANAARAAKHVKFRRKDWWIAGACFGMAVGIYVYTIYAMKQEKFLDDFDMPDPLEESARIKTRK